MPNTNIKNLDYFDNQSQLISKINNNFDEAIELHGGSQGSDGPTGDRGPIGEMGLPGPIGVSGPRGTRWFIQNTSPLGGPGDLIVEKDYWVNSNNGSISVFTETGWSYIGYNFNPTGSVFSGITSVYNSSADPAAGLTGTSVVEKQVDPSKYTFVISDNSPESGIINELLSKFVISTNAATNSNPLLEFSKSNIETGLAPDYALHPFFRWGNFGNGDSSIVLDVPGGALDVGASGGFESSFNDSKITSSTSVSFDIGSSVSGSGIFSTGGYQINANSGEFNIISSFLSITGASGSFSKPISTSVSTVAAVPSVYMQSGGTSGFRSSRSGDDHSQLSNSVYHAKLEAQSQTQFYLTTKGKLKTNKVDEGLTFPNNLAGITGTVSSNSVRWYMLSLPKSIDSNSIPLDSGNTIVFSPAPGADSAYVGIGIYTDPIYGYSFGSTGGLNPGQSFDIRIYCGSDSYFGYWDAQNDTTNYTGFKYIGVGNTSSISNKVTLPFKAQAIDLTVSRGVTGPLTTVYYKAYNTGVGGYGASGGYFTF